MIIITFNFCQLVRASDTKLKELIKFKSDEKYDDQSKLISFICFIVRKNIQQSLANKLKEITFKLRKREKKHYIKVQEVHDDAGSKGLRSTRDNVDKFLNDDSQMQVLEEDDEVDMTQRIRNKEIKGLVNTINDLAVLFKDLSVLVVE